MKETMNLGTDKVSELFRRLFIPTVFGMLCLSALTTVDGIFVGHGVGSDGIAAVNICIPLLMVLQGLGCSERVQSALRVSLLTALGCGALPTVFFMACPRFLVSLFLDVNTPAAGIAIAGFPYYAIGFVAFVVNLAVIGYYQSIERTALSVFLALLRGLLFLVPCFLLLPRWLGVEGIWLALSVSEILTFLIILLCAKKHRNH